MRTGTLLMASTLAFGTLRSAPARACGGTFCSSSPITQNAERVLFLKHGDSETTAVVQIQATGNDPDFAWVVPLESVPHDIHEESTNLFNALDAATTPTYLFTQASVPVGGGPTFGCGGGDYSAVPSANLDDDSRSAVHVWASGETGNFRYDVVSSDDATALRTWLDAHRYRTPDSAVPVIGEYVAEHKLFLAVRLSAPQGQPSFLVSPLAFTYAGHSPCVPIRLTRIATAPTLPILTYVVSDARAIPSNYPLTEVGDNDVLRLGPAGFNSASYTQLVSTAVAAAGGRAWVTEYAGALPDSVSASFPDALQRLLPARPYLTRLYTTIASDKMDRDPEFLFDATRGNVSNVHDLRGRTARASMVDLRFLLGAALFAGVARGARRLRRV